MYPSILENFKILKLKVYEKHQDHRLGRLERNFVEYQISLLRLFFCHNNVSNKLNENDADFDTVTEC